MNNQQKRDAIRLKVQEIPTYVSKPELEKLVTKAYDPFMHRHCVCGKVISRNRTFCLTCSKSTEVHKQQA